MAYQIPTIIEKLTAKAVKANRSLTLDSAKWFQRKLEGMPQIYSHKLLREQWHNTHPRSLRGRRNFLGRMFTFVYEAKTKNKSVETKPNRMINEFLFMIFNMEKYLLKLFNFPFGLSLIVIAKKIK